MRTMKFPHKAPKNHEYWTDDFNTKYLRIWIKNKSRYFNYCEGYPSSVWGFMNKKTGVFHSPVNSKKVGKIVDTALTSPYSAMTLNLNPLMAAFQ